MVARDTSFANYRFAVASFYSSSTGQRVEVGQRVAANDPLVQFHPENFREFHPPTFKD